MATVERETVVLTVDVKSLKSALGSVWSVIPTRSPKPILKNVLLVADPADGTTLEATDLEIGVRVRVVGVSVDAACRVVLPPDRLNSILTAAEGRKGNDTVRIAVGPDQIDITGTGIKFALPVQDPAEFPAVPDFPEDAPGVELTAAHLRTLIRHTTFAADLESTRYALGGCLLEVGSGDEAGKLSFVATDGRRLARQTVFAAAEENAFRTGAVAVASLKSLKLIDKLIGDGDTPARVVLGYNRDGSSVPYSLNVKHETGTVQARLVEGRFPAWRQILPGKVVCRSTLPVSELLWGCESAAVMTAEESRGIDFDFGPGTGTVRATAAERGSGQVQIEITDHSGPEWTTTIDSRYMACALEPLDRSGPIAVEYEGDKSAVVFRNESGFLYVVMPLVRETFTPPPPAATAAK